MKKSMIALIIITSLISCNSRETFLYVGTYTGGESEGIYKLTFNLETGEIGEKQLVSKTNNPSFIALSSNKKFMYAINEINDYNGEVSGAVEAYSINKDGNLQLLNKVSSKGAHPCHISVDQKNKKVVVSNYTGGTVAIYNINTDGSLSKAVQVLNHNLDSVKSHAHSAKFIKNSLIVADLGRNSVFEYENKQDIFQLKTNSLVEKTENAGPRHFITDNSGVFLYVINEYANTVTSIKKEGGNYKLIQNESTLSNDFEGTSFCADIHISKNQQFFYGSNRGENSIVVFKRNLENGTLQKIQNISTEGDWPRNFTLSTNDKFLLVANQKSNSISIFDVNAETGELSFIKKYAIGAPVCLVF